VIKLSYEIFEVMPKERLGGQWYSDTSPFSISCINCLTEASFNEDEEDDVILRRATNDAAVETASNSRPTSSSALSKVRGQFRRRKSERSEPPDATSLAKNEVEPNHSPWHRPIPRKSAGNGSKLCFVRFFQ